MKYMITWVFTPESTMAVRERFKDPEPMGGVKQLGRWHQVGTNRGFRLIETDDPVALSKLSIYWADLIDMKIVPVVEDDEIVEALSG